MDERDVTRQMEDTADEAREQTAGAREQARDYGIQARERAREMRERLSDNARSLTDKARSQVSQGAEQLRHRSESLIGEQKSRAADEVLHLSSAIHSAADRLRSENNAMIAGYADSLASQLDRTADYLRSRDLSGLMRDVQSFARRRPEMVLGGMFLAGLAIARVVKAGGDLSMGLGRSSEQDFDRGYSAGDEYGSYSGYRGGSEIQYDNADDMAAARQMTGESGLGITNPAFDTGGGTGLAGGLEHVERPATPGSIGGSTATDADITNSSDIDAETGIRPGGSPSVQP